MAAGLAGDAIAGRRRWWQVQMPFESYNGINVRLRYFIRATISKRFGDIVTEKDFWVHRYQSLPEINHSIKMEVRLFGHGRRRVLTRGAVLTAGAAEYFSVGPRHRSALRARSTSSLSTTGPSTRCGT